MTGRSTPRDAGGAGRGSRVPGPTVPVYVISVAAELTGLHPQTLRQYDRRGWCHRDGPVVVVGATRCVTSSCCARSRT